MQNWTPHIAPRVHLVGSGMMGFRLTQALDCNVWLLDGGDEWALIDSGSGVEPERIADNIEACLAKNGATGKLKTLVLTHAHGDHAAGANFLRDRFNLQVACLREAAPCIESGDMEWNSLRLAKVAGAPYPPDFVMQPCEVARPLDENDIVNIGDISLRVLATPGHSHGHLSLWWESERALFSGDVIFARGKVVLQNIWDCSIPEHAASIRALHDLKIETLFPGHGAPLFHDARIDVAMAHKAFSKLGVPYNLS